MSERQKTTAEPIVDNDRVRITRYTWGPGAETGWHKHPYDYVIVPYRDCKVRVETAIDSFEAGMFRDQPYFREKGVEHNVISIETEDFALIEIEIK
ncbi:MAG: cupin [Hyphomicrobiaceae bacterium]